MFWLLLLLTPTVFLIIRKLAVFIRSPLFNPLLISMAIIITILLTTGISYDNYFAANSFINDLLQPAVVALAYPLYEQLSQIRSRWKSILIICFTGTIVAISSGTLIAFGLGATTEIAASVLPKSVTTPIAMSVSQSLGGIPAVSAICVICVGVFGAILGHVLLKLAKVNNTIAKGLAIGATAHALGTARAAEIDYQQGAYSSLALVVCGIMTPIIAPFLFPVLVAIYALFY